MSQLERLEAMRDELAARDTKLAELAALLVQIVDLETRLTALALVP